ncbi:MAG: TonB-dependent receptor [Acidobacteriia bacterium]|nr:TonB-dependent receptor [Terriglobia bacterium]
MRLQLLGVLAAFFLFWSAAAWATIFGHVRGTVRDPQNYPIVGARVTIRAAASAWSQAAQSNAEGEFEFNAIPAGEYVVTVEAQGFSPMQQRMGVAADTAPVLHFPLTLAPLAQKVTVLESPEPASTAATATQTIVNRAQIAETPGADRSNSLAMITDYVPGAVIRANLLKIRGGEQVTWLVDGVPVPNDNIGINVGPHFDPKDIDYIELKRGGYSAEYGGRTYGIFNVVTRSGFERHNEGELVTSYGNFNETNDQVSLGSHSDRFAYYASLNGNRTDLGLSTPNIPVLHDQGAGLGGFGSLIFNVTPGDQLRLVTALRQDRYQIPNTPEQQALGMRDVDRESDAFVNFSWVHTVNSATVLTVSPYYHFNRAEYIGGEGDWPIIPGDDRASTYVGVQASLAVVEGKSNLHLGVQTLAEHDDMRFDVTATDGSGLAVSQRTNPWGNLEAAFVQEQYKLTPWLTLNGGARVTRFSGLFTETSVDPRTGAAIRVPKLRWVLHGFYGRSYQPPPLDSVAGPLLQFAVQKGFGFSPLHGERDEQYEFGLTIPYRGWVLDVGNFRTRARDYLDHNVLGNSNIFLPLTIQGARIRGWEATLRSPQLFHRAQINLAYSRMQAEGWGGITGGMTDFEPPEAGYFPLDHDQRNTVSAVISSRLPRGFWTTATVAYGSGFLKGDGPAYLPAHTTFDVSVGRQFGENWSLALTALNAANHRYLLDEGNSFEGTHFADPRRVSLELRYRFHY